MFINFKCLDRDTQIDLNVAKINYVRKIDSNPEGYTRTSYRIDIDETVFTLSEADYERCIVPLRFIEHRPYKPTAAANAAHSTKATVDEIMDAEDREFNEVLDSLNFDKIAEFIEGELEPRIDIFGDVAGEGDDDNDWEDDGDDDGYAFGFTPESARMLADRINKMLPSVRASEEKARGGHPELHYVIDEGGA